MIRQQCYHYETARVNDNCQYCPDHGRNVNCPDYLPKTSHHVRQMIVRDNERQIERNHRILSWIRRSNDGGVI